LQEKTAHLIFHQKNALQQDHVLLVKIANIVKIAPRMEAAVVCVNKPDKPF
jgi:hypothetical protein